MKIIAITGCRSEIDIISPVIECLKLNKHNIKVILSGSHLSKWHGDSLKKLNLKDVKIFQTLELIKAKNQSNIFFD